MTDVLGLAVYVESWAWVPTAVRVAVGWLVLALAAGLIVGRVIRTRDQEVVRQPAPELDRTTYREPGGLILVPDICEQPDCLACELETT